jgi:hypothetical protein
MVIPRSGKPSRASAKVTLKVSMSLAGESSGSSFGTARYYGTPGTRLRWANDARTISTVGELLSPSGVVYILQPSA